MPEKIESDKKLVKVILQFDDGSEKKVNPRETDIEARDRLTNPFLDTDYDDVLKWIVPKLNKMGGQLDIAFCALIAHGMDGVEAENEINKLIEGEMF